MAVIRLGSRCLSKTLDRGMVVLMIDLEEEEVDLLKTHLRVAGL